MSENKPLIFLCLTNEFKGLDFLRYCKKEGNKVFLVTSKKNENMKWPFEVIDEVFYMEDPGVGEWNMKDLVKGTAHLFRTNKIDRIVALDDFDVEKAAHLREVFRIPGMGETTQRYFRDKLAMRIKAKDAGIPVPEFSDLFNDSDINQYLNSVPAPWILKPRGKASASGMKKLDNHHSAWEAIHGLGDNRHDYLIEKFTPGSVYHADSISLDGKVLFCRVSKYLDTPFEVAHGGGIFRSAVVEFNSEEDKKLQKLNADVMKAFGMKFSAAHTEFIRGAHDDKYYFLETSSRVGGAHLSEMVEYSSGINLWGEWAKMETAMAKGNSYALPKSNDIYSGIIVSLSRFAHPDTSSFSDPEICWRIDKEYHIGFIVKSSSRERILELLDNYCERIARDFHASAPSKLI